MAIFGRARVVKVKRLDIPKGLWRKCDGCDEMITNPELSKNLQVCPRCGHHYRMSAWERIASMTDLNTFEEHFGNLYPQDPLKFVDKRPYPQRQEAARKKSGIPEAVITGVGEIDGIRTALAVMDFTYMGGSMGSVVGEKITRVIELAVEEGLSLVIVSCSGGARMQEGVLSLMQLAKTSGALARHRKAGLFYVSVLAHPTTGGTTASFASLGDVILAEPGALIGFAGPRVIRETIQQELPEGFQTSEFLLRHGLVDMIVHRKDLKATLARLIGFFSTSEYKGAGRDAGAEDTETS